jgi:hypothetical protein
MELPFLQNGAVGRVFEEPLCDFHPVLTHFQKGPHVGGERRTPQAEIQHLFGVYLSPDRFATPVRKRK